MYVVTVSNVFGNGTLGLNLADNGSIVDAAYPTLALGDRLPACGKRDFHRPGLRRWPPPSSGTAKAGRQ